MSMTIETTDRDEIKEIFQRECETHMPDGQAVGLEDVIDAIVDCVEVTGGCVIWSLPRGDDGCPRAHVGGVKVAMTNGNSIWSD